MDMRQNLTLLGLAVLSLLLYPVLVVLEHRRKKAWEAQTLHSRLSAGIFKE